MVTLFSHIGLGDIILLSGAIVRLTQRHGKLRIYCYAHHYASVVSFFKHCVGVHIVPLASPPGLYGVPEESALVGVDGPVMRSGHYAEKSFGPADKSFPELFYQQLGVPWVERWSASVINQAASWIDSEEVCDVFVHDDTSRGFVITRLNSSDVYRPSDGGNSILRHATALRSAREIHVIDSCFYHLVESLEGINARLFLHRYARAFIPIWNDYPRRHKWEILV